MIRLPARACRLPQLPSSGRRAAGWLGAARPPALAASLPLRQYGGGGTDHGPPEEGGSSLLPFPPAQPSLLQATAPAPAVAPTSSAAAPAPAPAALSSNSMRLHTQQCGAEPSAPPDTPATATEASAAAARDASIGEPTAEAGGPPWELVKTVALAGGMLDVVRLEGDRMLRVWMPPGEHQAQPVPLHPPSSAGSAWLPAPCALHPGGQCSALYPCTPCQPPPALVPQATAGQRRHATPTRCCC